MNKRSIIQDQIEGEQDGGFTLIEILIAIVLVGILSAVAVVGISNLVSKGSSSACGASLDAAKAGSAVYFTELATYPTTLAAVANGTYLTLPTGVTVNAAAVVAAPPHPAAAANMQTTGATWRLTMTTPGTATAAPVFGCT
ncbi:MAG TPA: prepilin-type N-terminal cleavage/methylation domain-containing protein [Ilumatobacteraceae bacterium]